MLPKALQFMHQQIVYPNCVIKKLIGIKPRKNID